MIFDVPASSAILFGYILELNSRIHQINSKIYNISWDFIALVFEQFVYLGNRNELKCSDELHGSLWKNTS